MSTNTLIALDLVATAIIIILFSIRLLFSKRIKHSAALSRSYRMNQEPRPGVIFCFLTGVKDIFRTELGKNGRYARIDTIKDHLKMIINDPGKKHSDMDIADARFDFDEDQKLIIKNLAQCLITFLNQLRTEQEPALFDYTQFEAGLAEIVSAINQFFNQDITYKKFMNKIISGKNQIFLSLLGGRKYD